MTLMQTLKGQPNGTAAALLLAFQMAHFSTVSSNNLNCTGFLNINEVTFIRQHGQLKVENKA
jgi:hypothetical protein